MQRPLQEHRRYKKYKLFLFDTGIVFQGLYRKELKIRSLTRQLIYQIMLDHF